MKKVQDIMANDVVTANPEMNVVDAAKLMLKEDVGCLVIMEGNEIKGIVTDRDLMSCDVKGHNIQECRISNHMTSPVITAQPDVLLYPPGQVDGRKANQASPYHQRESTCRNHFLLRYCPRYG